MSRDIEVSVVVASHRPGLIGGLADCFPGEADGAVAWELIIVADYAVEPFREKYQQARWIFVDDTSISRKRNRGVREAAGPVVAFIDDDCRPLAGWLREGLARLRENPGWAGVEGQTLIAGEDRGNGRYREFKRLESRGYRTNNIFYRTDTFREAGGFDERFTVQREDIDLAFTIMGRGGEIGFCTTARVEHLFREGEKWDLLKNCINRRFDPLLYKKHRAAYRRRFRSPVPGTVSTVLCLHTAVAVALVTGHFVAHTIAVDTAVTVAPAIRATGMKNALTPALVREWVSRAISPAVLFGALIYGSIKYRCILLW